MTRHAFARTTPGMPSILDVHWHPDVLQHDTGAGLFDAADPAGSPYPRRTPRTPTASATCTARCATARTPLTCAGGTAGARRSTSWPGCTTATTSTRCGRAHQQSLVDAHDADGAQVRGRRCWRPPAPPSPPATRCWTATPRWRTRWCGRPGTTRRAAPPTATASSTTRRSPPRTPAAAAKQRVAILDWRLSTTATARRTLFYERDDVLTVSGTWRTAAGARAIRRRARRPRPAPRPVPSHLLGREERLEDARLRRCVHPRSAVLDGDEHVGPGSDAVRLGSRLVEERRGRLDCEPRPAWRPARWPPG